MKEWNDLPPELKLACIRPLDVESRCQIRSTSKTEQELVDREKIRYDILKFVFEKDQSLTIIVAEYKFRFNKASIRKLNPEMAKKKVVYLLSYFLNLSSAVNFLSLSGFSSEIFDGLRLQQKFNVEYLSMTDMDQSAHAKVFEICNLEKLTSVRVVSDRKMFSVNAISAEMTNQVNFFVIEHKIQPTIGIEFAKRWIDEDAPISQYMRFYTDYRRVRRDFRMTFEDLLVDSDHDHSVRIATNNPSKHILLYWEKASEVGYYPYRFPKGNFILWLIPSTFTSEDIKYEIDWHTPCRIQYSIDHRQK